MLGRLLGGPSGAVVGEIVAGALGVKPKPEDVIEAIAKQGDSEQLLIAAEQEHRTQLTALLIEERKAETAAQVQAVQSVNLTMREEMKAEGWFFRSWRPLAGWVVVLCFAAVVFNGLVLLWVRPEHIRYLIEFISGTTLLWTFAFAIVGVYVHKRSVDKQLEAGYPTSSLTEKALAKSRETLENLF